MKDAFELLRNIRLEGHGSGNLAKGLGLVLRSFAEAGASKPSFMRRLVNFLARLRAKKL